MVIKVVVVTARRPPWGVRPLFRSALRDPSELRGENSTRDTSKCCSTGALANCELFLCSNTRVLPSCATIGGGADWFRSMRLLLRASALEFSTCARLASSDSRGEYRGVESPAEEIESDAVMKKRPFDPNQSLTKAKELVSARLGLPTISGQCTTCTATSVDKCQGHFGHVLLPTPILHPNHVGRLIRLLRKVCLNCGKLKKKPVGRTRTSANEQTLKKGKKNGGPKKTKSLSEDPILSNGTSRRKRKFSSFIDDEAEASEVIVLSSEDEELSSNGRKQQKSPDSIVEEDILGGKASTSSAKRSWNGKRKNQADTSETNSTTTTPTVVDLTDMLVCVKKSKKPKALKIIRKIPVGTLAKLGMQLDMAHPEALIVECLPVPPNCSRLQEDPFSTGGTNIGFKIGVSFFVKYILHITMDFKIRDHYKCMIKHL
ncbi:hypothetical protein MPTK2_7g09520 [Marchantia polymorpha subsp. ruderalis]